MDMAMENYNNKNNNSYRYYQQPLHNISTSLHSMNSQGGWLDPQTKFEQGTKNKAGSDLMLNVFLLSAVQFSFL
jgi:regulatory protein YycH of two-component signal transduction system YycFG